MREASGWKGVRRAWDKYRYAALVMALGVGLMVLPAGRRESVPAGEAAQVRDLRQEMEEALGKISGVGRVRLVLAEESDGERILASDRTASSRGEGEYSESSEIVLLDGSGTDGVVVLKRVYPAYRGALVVCQGGDRPSVRLAVTQAVSALTGLSADRIAVEKWQ